MIPCSWAASSASAICFAMGSASVRSLIDHRVREVVRNAPAETCEEDVTTRTASKRQRPLWLSSGGWSTVAVTAFLNLLPDSCARPVMHQSSSKPQHVRG